MKKIILIKPILFLIIIFIMLLLSGCIGWDSDGDGVSDSTETKGNQITVYNIDGTIDTKTIYSNPNKVDSDKDGLSDFEEMLASTDPSNSDTDGDGLNDNKEKEHGSSPIHFDTWITSIKGEKKRVYANFTKYGALPTNFDSDGDGLLDYDEYLKKSDPSSPDTDGDGTYDSIDPDPLMNLGVKVILYDFMLLSSKDLGSGADVYFIIQVGNISKTMDSIDIDVNEEISLDQQFDIDFQDGYAYSNDSILVRIFAYDEDDGGYTNHDSILIDGTRSMYEIEIDINDTIQQGYSISGSDGELDFSIEILRS